MIKNIEVEVSARHIHLSKADFDFLFGENADYQELHELSQSKEYATDKEVEIIGPKGSLNARFLSPFRETTQVEISLTDSYQIGIKPPYEIEVVDDAAEVVIKGAVGEIKRNAAIIAKRHLHCNRKEAEELKIKDHQQVSVKISTDRGNLTFENITAKIADSYNLRIHLDTDEGNAAGIKGQVNGELII